MISELRISADSHVLEPPEVFEPLASRFGERAPHVVYSAEKGYELDNGRGRRSPIGGLATAGIDPRSPDWDEAFKRGYDVLPSLRDGRERAKDQDRDGVAAEVLYPSLMFSTFSRQEEETDLVVASFASYNAWLADHVKDAPGRLFGLACLQLKDLDAAIAEMERAKQLGHVGVCIPCTAPLHRPYSDRFYDRFWAAAQEMSMPLTLHIATGAADIMPAYFRERSHHSWIMQPAIAGVLINDLILSGVCERFPGIKFVPTEFDAGWLSTHLPRMDWAHYRFGDQGGLTMDPSEYWRRNFLATFEDDAAVVRVRDLIGVKTLMWANDYPHGDSIWPESQETLDRIMQGCTPDDRHKLIAKNVVDLYGLPFEA